MRACESLHHLLSAPDSTVSCSDTGTFLERISALLDFFFFAFFENVQMYCTSSKECLQWVRQALVDKGLVVLWMRGNGPRRGDGGLQQPL